MNSIPLNSILSSTYFGPVQWYQKLAHSDTVYLEQHDHFIKQTYRNRCVIATTQGPQALTVPVESPQGLRIDKTEMKDVRISDHGSWRHLHWQALQSAYGESPFFEFYADDLHPFFEKHWDYLFDFNLAIMQKMCELLDIEPHIELTEEYMQPDGMVDYRDAIRPKHPVPDSDFVPKPYYQVYQQKHGFLANLSILDLLFNMGPESIFYL